MWSRALVSVSDKAGLLELLSPLVKEGLQIVSTGGTAKYLQDHGLPVTEISEVTGFPEVMDGRVKTLHPKIHMALLGRKNSEAHLRVMKDHGVQGFDLVVVNLYPFEEAVKAQASMDELIEKIDIGGPSMLRSAAKNHDAVAVLCDPKDYSWFLENRSDWTVEKSRQLAAKVYAHTSVYDSLIARELGYSGGDLHPMGGARVQKLRYGENPHQEATWYRWPGDRDGLASAKILQGKELSYNNLLDIEASVGLVREMVDPAAVAVKHNNPCGAATSGSFPEAVRGALRSDPVSVFGGIVALNREVGLPEAQMLSEVFLECIVAPSYTDEAKQVFSKKKNLRVLEWPHLMKASKSLEIRTIAGGFLAQTPDQFSGMTEAWKVYGQFLTEQRRFDFLFGEKVCGALKSNAIALVADGVTVGLGMGQVNRVDAVDQAIRRCQSHHPQLDMSRVSLVSDAFFPFPDSVEKAAAAGIRWILQPGGSLKDQDVLAAAQNCGVTMVLTGKRHFRH